MFDVGFFELLLIAIISLIILGPERLPHAARMAGAWVAKIRRTMTDVKIELTREVEMQELQQRIQELQQQDELQEIQQKLNKPFKELADATQTLKEPPSQKEDQTINPKVRPTHD